MLRRPIEEIFDLPSWEIVAWREVFELVGPLDWTRGDWLDARSVRMNAAGDNDTEGCLFYRLPEPIRTEREEIERRKNQLNDF